MIDFTFTELMAWQKAKTLLDSGAIGRLRHVDVLWNVENASTRLRLKNWKTSGEAGGGALGNLASHSLHYFEWFCGPLTGLSARLSGLPDDPAFETGVTLSLAFQSGASGSLTMSCASYLGSGHRLEFYGDDGTLLLVNPTTDYMRGFVVSHARRPGALDADRRRGRSARPPVPRRGAHRAGLPAGQPVPRRDRRQADRLSGLRAKATACRRCSTRCGTRTPRAAGSTSSRRASMNASTSGRRILVTGGSGFIGSALVKALVKDGNTVRVLDDNSRGAPRRLEEVKNDIEFIGGDVRDAAAVERAVRGMDEVHHLAFVNGTEFFYSAPELVLDVGVKGMINVIDACRAANVRNLVLASSSEVYQTPPHGADRRARAAAGAGPDQPALLLRRRQDHQRADGDQLRTQAVRPGADLPPAQRLRPGHGLRARGAAVCAPPEEGGRAAPDGKVPFEIQGDGRQTRSFCHVDDLVAGVMVMRDKGEHLGIYHIGTREEVTIGDVARRIAAIAGREIEFVTRPAPPAAPTGAARTSASSRASATRPR